MAYTQRGYTPPPPNLLLNLAPVQIHGRTITAVTIPFESSDQLRGIRSDYSAEYESFVNDNTIVCIPIVDSPAIIAGAAVQTSYEINSRAVARLLRRALVQHFVILGRTVLDFDPIAVLAAG